MNTLLIVCSLLATVGVVYVEGTVNVLILCPDGCASDADTPIDWVARQVSSAAGVHTAVVGMSFDVTSFQTRRWDVIFTCNAVINYRTVVSSLSKALVVVLDDPRAAEPLDVSAALSSEVYLPLPWSALAAAVAAVGCRVSTQGSIYFTSSGWGGWDRAMRTALITRLSARCPGVSIGGTYGPTLTSIGISDVIVAFGSTAVQRAQQYAATASPCVQVIPVVVSGTLVAPPSSVAVDYFTRLQPLLSDPSRDAFLAFATVATLQNATTLKICNAALWNSAFSGTAVVKTFVVSTNTNSSQSGGSFQKATISNPGVTNIGTSYTLSAGGLLYVFPSATLQPVTIFDPVALTLDVLPNASIFLPRSAAFSPLPSMYRGGALGKAFVHGGIFGTTFSSLCGFVTVYSPGNVTYETFTCSSCPSLMYHTATAVPDRGVVLVGGQLPTFYLSDQLYWFNFTSLNCDQNTVQPSGTGPGARMRHGSALWPRQLNLGGIDDDMWVVVSGGIVGVTAIFDVWLFAVNQNLWYNITIGDNIAPPPVQKPLVSTSDTTLVVVGQTAAVIFSAALGTWAYGASSTYGYFTSPVESVASQASPNVFTFATMVSDGRGTNVPWSGRVNMPQCRGNTVPAATLDACQSCPQRSVKENGLCVPCAWRHYRPDTPYAQKLLCWNNYESESLVGFVIVCLITLLIPFASRFAMWYINSLAKAQRNQAIALEVTKAVAGLTLDRVAQLEGVANPTKVEVSMKCCVANLKRFRLAIPDSVLRVVDSCTKRMEHPDDASLDRDVSDASTELRTAVSASRTEKDKVSQQRRHSSLFANSAAMNDSDQLVVALLDELNCALRLSTAAVAVFTVADMPKWAETQRASELPRRAAKLYDVVLTEISRSGGVADALVGDRIFASWNTSTQVRSSADCFVEGARCALTVTRSAAVDRLGLSVHAGVSYGNVRCGFVGCQGEEAPPYRQFTVLGPVLAEAVNLSQAARQLRLGTLVTWSAATEAKLRPHFVVKFTARLQFGHSMGPSVFAGELICTQSEKEVLWDMMRLAEAVNKFNYYIANYKQPAKTAMMLREELPPSYVSVIHHSMVTGKLPQEIITRAW